MNMSVGGGAKRFIEASGRNNRLAPAAGQVRHGAAARLAERRCKASSLGQVETHDGRFSPKPSKRRGFDDDLARMRSPGCFPATRAMAVQEVIEWSIDLKRDLATYAAPPKCCHSRFLAWYVPAQRLAASSCIEDCRRQPPAASHAVSLSACQFQLQGRSSASRLIGCPLAHAIAGSAVGLRASRPTSSSQL
jgi:hypothetical protein